jgi:ABC-type dipeptide/oligopeptide/nickel transport system permease subunit
LTPRLRSDRAALAAAVVLVLIVLVAAAAPLIVDLAGISGPNARDQGAVTALAQPAGPSSAHPLGVDDLGRDVLARVLYGARTPLEVASLGALLAIVLGTLIGAGAGLAGIWPGRGLMAAVEALLAFPALLLGIGIGTACRGRGCAGGVITPGLRTLVAIVALAGAALVAHLVAARVRWLRTQPFVETARALGASGARLLRREILPGLLPTVVAMFAFLIPAGILLESALSFLGLGVGSRTADWGAMIASAGADIKRGTLVWWYLLAPGLALFVTMLAGWRLALGIAQVRAPSIRRSPSAQSAASLLALRAIGRAIVLIVLVAMSGFLLLTVLPNTDAARLHVPGQLGDYLRGIFVDFDFGHSVYGHHRVLHLVIENLPATISLVGGAVVVWFLLGSGVTLVGAVRPGRRLDRAAMTVARGLGAVPVFWLGLLALYLFANDVGRLAILPGAGTYTGLTADPSRWFRSLLLPWLVLGATQAGLHTPALRARLGAALNGDLIREARAIGLSVRGLLWRNVLPAAVRAGIGWELSGLLGAVVLTEAVFRIHGVGLLITDAIANGDFPVIEGTAVLVGICLVVVRLVYDLACAARLAREGGAS